MKRTGPRTEPRRTPKVRGDEGELCEGIPTEDVRDERYEVNIVVKQRKCQTRWKDDGGGWSDREYQRQLIDQVDKGRKLVAWDGIRKMVVQEK